MVIGKIEQLTEIPVKETGKVVLPIINKRGEERVYPGITQTDWVKTPDKVPPPEVLRHEWSYAMLPGGAHFNPYLTGFCKNCHTAFTVRLKSSDNSGILVISGVDIPLYGCEYKKY